MLWLILQKVTKAFTACSENTNMFQVIDYSDLRYLKLIVQFFIYLHLLFASYNLKFLMLMIFIIKILYIVKNIYLFNKVLVRLVQLIGLLVKCRLNRYIQISNDIKTYVKCC